MHRSTGLAIATVVGTAAIVAPIWLSLHLAWVQSIDGEQVRVQTTIRDVLRRPEKTGSQIAAGIQKLKQANLPPCSPSDIDVMRQVDVASSNIQAVARIRGDNLTCTSLGTTDPIPVGPVTLTTVNGVDERLDIVLPIAGGQSLDVISLDGYAFLVSPSLQVDSPTEGPDIALSLYVASSPDHRQIGGTGSPIRPEWYRSIPAGSEATFISDGYLVCLRRSQRADLAVIAATPISYVTRQVTKLAVIFVPLGLLCGFALAWAVLYVTRRGLSMPSLLRSAARRREFYLEYQPIVEMETGRWVGAEALVRWRRAGRVLRPDFFISVAEENGIITQITQCVSEIVADDLPLMVSIDPDFNVSVNLSADDLRSEGTLKIIGDILGRPGVRPANLEVEATERGFFQGQEALDIVDQIRSMGVTVAIDDFGTGYSSLARLQTLSADTLKIDKAFIDSIGTDGATSHVVLHIIEMAHALKLELVAEGVETEAQASLLRKRGVRYAQGFLYARPMPLAALCEALVAAKSAPHRTSV